MIDDGFKKAFFLKGPVHESTIDFELERYYNKYDKDLMTDIIHKVHNLVITGNAIGYTYGQIVAKVYEVVDLTLIDIDDLNNFISLYATKYAAINKLNGIEKYVRVSRDIYSEVAAIKFNVNEKNVSNRMIDDVMAADNENSYGIIGDVTTNWDDYFYNMCLTVGRNSKCLSRRIGAVLVKDKSIISTGYNGPPRGIPACNNRWVLDKEFRDKYGKTKFKKPECPRKMIGFKSGEGLEVCIAGHAERNALINAARNGISTLNTTLYMSCGIPCTPCLVEIINSGVEGIVVTKLSTYDESAMYLLKNSDLKIRLYNFL